MELWQTLLVTIIGTFGASSGFWTWLQKRSSNNNVERRMLLGIAHDRLVFLSMMYIDRGECSKEEYENIHKYLYEPYKELGGNGTVTKLMNEVERLPITSSIYFKEDDHNEHNK